MAGVLAVGGEGTRYRPNLFKRLALENKIAAIQEAFDTLVGSPQLVAHQRGWANEAVLRATAAAQSKSEYWRKLLRILDKVSAGLV
jgi:hypothetical protein